MPREYQVFTMKPGDYGSATTRYRHPNYQFCLLFCQEFLDKNKGFVPNESIVVDEWEDGTILQEVDLPDMEQLMAYDLSLIRTQRDEAASVEEQGRQVIRLTRKFLENKGEKCLFCQSTDIGDQNAMNSTTSELTQEKYCRGCKKCWYNVYTLTGVRKSETILT